MLEIAKRSRPTVTFVVPARNEERYIGACIESLRAQELGADAEIVVIDNGSCDDTAARACASGARVIAEPRPGLAHARQAGLEAAHGEFLIYVDADTRLPSGWTCEVLRHFADDGDLVAFSPGFTFYDGRAVDNLGNLVFRTLLCPATNLALRRSKRPGVLIGSAIALRTEALRQAGGVDLEFQFYGEDTMLARRLHTQGKVCFSRKPAYLTSARRYKQGGILHVIYRYFLIFAIIHAGRMETASTMARRFHVCDQRGPGTDMCRRHSFRHKLRRVGRNRR